VNIDSDQCPQLCDLALLHENLPEYQSIATLILAHGAGAPMDSPFMNAMVQRLVNKGIAVLRFEFPFMEARRRNGVRRPPDAQKVLLACWKEVFERARQTYGGPLAIGGKSMGGRMASLVADELGATSLVCLGYPFYAAGKPEKPRVAHLEALKVPTLIVQGERDPMGNRQTVEGYRLSPSVRLHWLGAADHDLKPLKSSGFSHDEHLDAAAEAVVSFLKAIKPVDSVVRAD
jgi:predicted alpha/beta-hydrolase family hydrolase